ncbi:MAG: hypothetical protein HY867_14310 [Chloroflexi bacterium]|nr:hypothetical protein [Chloroflexota bacterium]
MKKTFVIYFLLCLLISACAVESNTDVTATTLASPTTTRRPTFTPRPTSTLWPTQALPSTRTPTLTFTPTYTSTPQPALESHTWPLERVLIMVDGLSGDGGYQTFSYPPGFVLLFDGSFFYSRFYEENGDWKINLYHVDLGRKRTCQFLNTIDQNGFLDYDPTTYKEPLVDGGPTTIITINAWKRLSGTFYDLDHVVRGVHEDVNFPPEPSLLRTYNLLEWYDPEGQIYVPDRVALWIYENTWSSEDRKPYEQEWKLTTPRLADLHSLTGSAVEKSNGQYVTYRGDIARNIFRDLNNWNDHGVFVENDRQYTVFAQVLLPYQVINNFPEERGYVATFTDLSNPRPTLTCYPSDGLLPIPTPPSE